MSRIKYVFSRLSLKDMYYRSEINNGCVGVVFLNTIRLWKIAIKMKSFLFDLIVVRLT